MILIDKLFKLYSDLSIDDFSKIGTIELRNDSDGKGDYIAKWEHPTLERPTQEQLDAVEE